MIDEKRKLQMLILSIAEDVTTICDENNIEYFMDGGTQLGAVRHKGFIPWDDDFDLAMKREDYDRFLRICEMNLDKNKYFLQTEGTENNYCFSFAKIQLKGTEILEDFSKNVDIQHGIFIDVFPYDNLPDNKIARKLFLTENHILKNLLWTKCGYGADWQKKKKSYIFFKLIGKCISIDRLKKLRDSHIRKFNNKRTKMLFNSDYPKNHLNNELFSKRKKYDFEDKVFWGFWNSNEFLTALYGSTYMELPPEEKRVQHSHYKIDFGKY